MMNLLCECGPCVLFELLYPPCLALGFQSAFVELGLVEMAIVDGGKHFLISII